MSAGLPHSAVLEEVAPPALCRELPDGVSAATHHVRPYSITQTLNDGAIIDLGDRKLEVLLTPGHAPDAVALIDREHGLLWPGDSFYEGPIWLYAPETSLVDYRESIHRLAALSQDLKAVLPSHNTPLAAPARLQKLAEAIDAVLTGRAQATTTAEGQLEFIFQHFSLLTAKDKLDAYPAP